MEDTLKRILKQEGVIGYIVIKIAGGKNSLCVFNLKAGTLYLSFIFQEAGYHK